MRPIRPILLVLGFLPLPALAQDAAPDREFDRIAEHVTRDAPSPDLVDRLYEFMEKYPKDPRSDRLQFWAGQVQQKRKFHNEAVKEFAFVVSDFPNSPLVLPALAAQAESHLATGHPAQAADAYRQVLAKRPPDLAANPDAAAALRDAVLHLAKSALEADDVDAAAKLYLQLPDRTQAITRTVELYIQHDRHEDALNAIAKLDDADRFLAYRLTATTYAARDGVANLRKLLARVVEREKPAPAVDRTLEFIVKAFAKKGPAETAKALDLIVAKYPPLKRWAQFDLCEIFKQSDPDRLRTFVGDYRTGPDVEKAKTWLGAYYEAAADVKSAQDAYRLLDDPIAAHFLIAETYYGPRARTKDYQAGAAELSAIVKRFYSNTASADALTRRAELEATPMKNPGKAINTLLELVDRFPREGLFPQNALLRVGHLQRAQQKQDDAIAAYEKLIIQYPDGPLLRQAWYQIALTHEEKKDPKRAMEVLKSILRKYPRTPEASAAHTRLENVYKLADTEVSDR